MMDRILNTLLRMICTLCILEVMSPQWSNFILTTHIPHSETNIFVFHGFNVKSWFIKDLILA